MQAQNWKAIVWGACLIGVGLSVAFGPAPPPPRRQIQVCMDENNLPYSSQKGVGIENELAGLLGRELHAEIQPVWFGPRRGLVNHTLGEGRCQVLLELPSHMPGKALTTRPYYRSSYVFVWRKDSGLNIRSLDDPGLKKLRIGAQITGDDFPPPVYVLAKNGSVGNVIGYSMYGEFGDPEPQAKIIDAVLRKEVDLAVVWGPVAGYFAKKRGAALEIVPIPPSPKMPQIPMAFDISVGVSQRQPELYQEISQVLQRSRPEIQRILANYGIPLADRTEGVN